MKIRDNLNCIAVEYRNARQLILVALFHDTRIDKVNCRLGIAAGEDELEDIRFVADYGSKLKKVEAKAFFPGHRALIESKWKYDD